MTKNNGYWLSYDLGFDGDYQGLYSWLDSVGAIECGDSLAFFENEYVSDPLKSMLPDLKKHTKLGKNARLYIIYVDKESGKTKGKFLLGKRKRAPWVNYSNMGIDTDEDFV